MKCRSNKTWMEEGERVGGRKVGKCCVDCCARINNIVALSRQWASTYKIRDVLIDAEEGMELEGR
eukprot:scaffold26859_cov78-Skeletonema_dohrnii-CCMP3373.AAC.2